MTASAPSASRSSTRWLFASGKEFDKDLADNADTRLLDVSVVGRFVEIVDDLADILLELCHGRDLSSADDLMQYLLSISRAGHWLIRAPAS